MSDKITYILEVLDKYSSQTRKFKKELESIDKVAKNLDKTLKKLNNSFNLKGSASMGGFGGGSSSRTSAIKKQFRDAEDLSRSAVRSAEIISRNRRAY
jgi:hypothetical protein